MGNNDVVTNNNKKKEKSKKIINQFNFILVYISISRFRVNEKSILGLIFLFLIILYVLFASIKDIYKKIKEKTLFSNKLAIILNFLFLGIIFFSNLITINKNIKNIPVVISYYNRVNDIKKVVENTEIFYANNKKLEESKIIKEGLLKQMTFYKIITYQVINDYYNTGDEKVKIFNSNLELKNQKNEKINMKISPIFEKIDETERFSVNLSVGENYHIYIKKDDKNNFLKEGKILIKYINKNKKR